MATVTTLLNEVESRLNDPTNVVWTEAELKSAIRYHIKSLFPTYFRLRLEETTAGPGPMQPGPSGARNFYLLGHKRATSSRVRPLRGWTEGEGKAFVPKTGITGDTLVWGWIEGWEPPTDDNEILLIPLEAEQMVILGAHKTALEKLLTNEVSQGRYLSLNVRQAATETDILDTIGELRQNIDDLVSRALPRPEVRS